MFQHILVPLDGSTHAERAIPVAARIARASGGTIILLRVVALPIELGSHLLQSSPLTRGTLQADTDAATHYLTTLTELDELEGIGLHMKVLAGDPARTILATAKEEQA